MEWNEITAFRGGNVSLFHFEPYAEFNDLITNFHLQLIIQNDEKYIVCHHDDDNYKFKSHLVMLLLDNMIESSGKRFVLMSQLINSHFEKFGEEMNDSLIESMNHLIEVQIDNNVQVVSLTKLAVFLLSIVNTLKSVHSITVSELKAKINSKINLSNACFEIGNFRKYFFLELERPNYFFLHSQGTQI